MSDDKKMNKRETAEFIISEVRDFLKKNEITSEYIEKMKKSSNSSHMIEKGQEPSTSKVEDVNMEDQPLQKESDEDEKEKGDNTGKEKKDDKESKEKTKNGHIMVDREDKGEQKDSDDGSFEFKKSESGMHTIEYKRLAKKGRCWDGYEPVKGKKAYSEDSCKKISKEEKKNPSFGISKQPEDKEMTDDQHKMTSVTKPGGKRQSRKDQLSYEAEAAERRNKMREEGLVKEEKGSMSVKEAISMIMSDKHGVNDVMDKVPADKRDDVLSALRNKDAKKAEMCKGYMDKCGEMKQGGYGKLKKFMHKKQK